MNCVERTLKQILHDDITDTDVKNNKIDVKIVKKHENSRFEVTDGDTKSFLEFEPTAAKFAKNIQENCVYTFFKLKKVSETSLCIKKNSYFEFKDDKREKAILSTTDLLHKKKNEVVTGIRRWGNNEDEKDTSRRRYCSKYHYKS